MRLGQPERALESLEEAVSAGTGQADPRCLSGKRFTESPWTRETNLSRNSMAGLFDPKAMQLHNACSMPSLRPASGTLGVENRIFVMISIFVICTHNDRAGTSRSLAWRRGIPCQGRGFYSSGRRLRCTPPHAKTARLHHPPLCHRAPRPAAPQTPGNGLFERRGGGAAGAASKAASGRASAQAG